MFSRLWVSLFKLIAWLGLSVLIKIIFSKSLLFWMKAFGKCIIDYCRWVFSFNKVFFEFNNNMLINMTVLLYTYFYNISLNLVRPTFFNMYNLPFLCSPNIHKIRVKINYFFYFLSSSTNRIVVFNNFFSLICSQPRDKQNHASNFLLFKYFLNNLLSTVFMENALSKLVELLQ